jgi:hypothetical protein
VKSNPSTFDRKSVEYIGSTYGKAEKDKCPVNVGLTPDEWIQQAIAEGLMVDCVLLTGKLRKSACFSTHRTLLADILDSKLILSKNMQNIAMCFQCGNKCAPVEIKNSNRTTLETIEWVKRKLLKKGSYSFEKLLRKAAKHKIENTVAAVDALVTQGFLQLVSDSKYLLGRLILSDCAEDS